MLDQFLTAAIESMNVDPALLSTAGVTVAGHLDRAENHVSAGYVLGDHLVVTCDPAVESMLTLVTADMRPSLEAWEQVATEAGGELVGRGRMQIHESQVPEAGAVPDGYSLRTLARTNPGDRTLIARLIEVSDEDDLDEAEIEIDGLDEIIEVLVDADGEIAAFSSACPFDLAPSFGDIGIMTRADCRGQGLGSFLVTALCARLSPAGLEPLYRCAEDNSGSIALSAGLKFSIATQLVAFRFPTWQPSEGEAHGFEERPRKAHAVAAALAIG